MSPILLAADTQLMWTVTAAGITIVFSVLLLLVGIFYLFGAIMKKTGSKGSKAKVKPVKAQAKTAAAPKAKFTPKQPPAIQVIEDGIPFEVVAAISAAVAEMEGGKAFTIRSVRKQQPAGGRPAWAMAGIAENTRPF